MSNIKLRFWCDTHGYVNSGFGEPIECVYFNQRGEIGLPCPLCHKSRPMKIEQWTGHYDKNHTEIYQGDIVSHDNTIGKFPRRFQGYEVRYVDSAFVIVNHFDDADRRIISKSEPYHIEIIGNARLNPELLKVQS